MDILRHYYSVTMFIDEDGNKVYFDELDTVEKIEKFKPKFYTETMKLKIVKETKKNYIVVDKDEGETYISKVSTDEEITLNSPIYPNNSSERLNCLLYTLDESKEIEKGQKAILNYFKNEFNIEMARQNKSIETLEKIFSMKK
jgi:NMD protein affecting ribosome stability and mRNA decay